MRFLRASALVLAALTVVASGSCSAKTPNLSGAGWPDVMLTAQTDTDGSASVTARPIGIGPAGATFEIQIELPGDGVAATPTDTSLTVDDNPWPSPLWEAVTAEHLGKGITAFRVHFDQGGMAIGRVELIVERSGSVHVFEWRI